MALKPEYNGDITKIKDAHLLVCRNRESGEFLGLYGLTSEGIFIRASRTWITATGTSRAQFSGSEATLVTPEFIDVYDTMDETGTAPTEADVAKYTDGKYTAPAQPAEPTV